VGLRNVGEKVVYTVRVDEIGTSSEFRARLAKRGKVLLRSS